MKLFNQFLSKTASTIQVPKSRICALMFAVMQIQQLQLKSLVEATDQSCATPPDTIDEPASVLGQALYLAKGTALIKSVSFLLDPAMIYPGDGCATQLVSFSLINWDGCTGVEVAKSVFQKSSTNPDKTFYSAVARFYPEDKSWKSKPEFGVQLPYENKYPDPDATWPKDDAASTGTYVHVTYASDPAYPSKWKQQFEVTKVSIVGQTTERQSFPLFKKPEFCEPKLKPSNSFMFSVRAIPKDQSRPLHNVVTARPVQFYDVVITLSQGDKSFADSIKTIGSEITFGNITSSDNYATWRISEISFGRWEVCGPGDDPEHDYCMLP